MAPALVATAVVGVRVGVAATGEPIVAVGNFVREGVTDFVGAGVRLLVGVRTINPEEVGAFVLVFKIMTGSFPLVAAAVCTDDEDDFVFVGELPPLLLLLLDEPPPETPPCCAVTTNPRFGA